MKMINHIKYLAIKCCDVQATANFYTKWFGMKIIGSDMNEHISITDGWVNISLIPKNSSDDSPEGLDHFGISVDSTEQLMSKFSNLHPQIKFEDSFSGLHYGDYIITDPNGTKISISESNFGLSPNIELSKIRLRHMSLCVDTGIQLRDFFTRTFEFREVKTSVVRREQCVDKLPFFFVGDGHINLGFLPKEIMLDKPDRKNLTLGHKKHGWFGHIGFVVPDMNIFMNQLDGKTAGRDMAEFRVWDPEGNAIDLSQEKGFEVDYDVWQKAI